MPIMVSGTQSAKYFMKICPEILTLTNFSMDYSSMEKGLLINNAEEELVFCFNQQRENNSGAV